MKDKSNKKTMFKNYIVDAVLLLAIGLFLLIHPSSTLNFLCTVFGVILLLMGVVKVLTYILAKDPQEKSVLSLIVAALQLIFGIWLLVKPEFFIAIFPIVAGLLIGYGAVVGLYETMQFKKLKLSGLTGLLVLSLVTLALAILVILHPTAIANIIIQVIGISMIVEGATLLIVMSKK